MDEAALWTHILAHTDTHHTHTHTHTHTPTVQRWTFILYPLNGDCYISDLEKQKFSFLNAERKEDAVMG